MADEDNPQYGTEGGNNTNDKVYLLSIEETTKNVGNVSEEKTNKIELFLRTLRVTIRIIIIVLCAQNAHIQLCTERGDFK